jgi:lipid II:glycine glycyltransferase (peptidoglycan interpeptide bridge formation enzyme)
MIDDINEEETEATNTTDEDQAGVATPGLSINDLRVFKQIIDICSARGAFKAEEFSSIGDAYERLASFLAMIDASNAEAEAEAEEGENAEADVDTTVSEEESNDDATEEEEA